MTHKSCPQTVYILVGRLEILSFEMVRDQCKNTDSTAQNIWHRS